MSDDATREYDFRQVWRDVPNQAEVESSDTLATIGFSAGPAESEVSGLPRVDHLMALGEVLGSGGNGEVVAAEQTSLHRTIAVKRPRGGAVGARLLGEARVIGFLEHPNIPPVHFVGSGERGDLLVGLKRIEGETLSARLARERPLDNLDENLDILIHICNAVGYAHSRGIVHLDLKPDNVMTGYFGEVYVLDWGLAAAFRDDVASNISRITRDHGVRGTPAFLAPEMIVGQDVTPATDVYLLGGLLHYVLTHEPPNAGATALHAIQSAYEPTQRVFDDRVPGPLADVCRRALAHDPKDRYRDADQFRQAIADYRRERRELEALGIARLKLAQLERTLEAAVDDGAGVYQAYGAARQAIDEAARLEADDAPELLQSLLEPMIRWEIERENVGGSERLLSDLPTTNPNLEAALDQLRQQRMAARAELHALRREVDPDFGARGKVLLVMGVGLTIAALEVVPYLLSVPPTTERVLGGYVAFLAVLSAITFLGRRALLQTRTNRGLTLVIWQLSVYGAALRIGAQLDVIALPAAIGYDLTLVWLGGLYSGLAFDRRILVAVPFYLVASIVVFTSPQLTFVTFGLSHFLGLTAIAVALAYGSTRTTS